MVAVLVVAFGGAYSGVSRILLIFGVCTPEFLLVTILQFLSYKIFIEESSRGGVYFLPC